jgi:leader peptidase (prepilin peptidase)/N-methyltransferase
MAKDLIPIISWVSLKGRCRYCGEKISARYTVIEVLGGAFAVAVTLLLGINIWALLVFILLGILTAASCIIYDKFVGKRE